MFSGIELADHPVNCNLYPQVYANPVISGSEYGSSRLAGDEELVLMDQGGYKFLFDFYPGVLYKEGITWFIKLQSSPSGELCYVSGGRLSNNKVCLCKLPYI